MCTQCKNNNTQRIAQIYIARWCTDDFHIVKHFMEPGWKMASHLGICIKHAYLPMNVKQSTINKSMNSGIRKRLTKPHVCQKLNNNMSLSYIEYLYQISVIFIIQGVTCIWANRGVSEEILDEGFQAFTNNHTENTSTSTLSINSVDSDESQSETTVIYCHRRRGSRASIQYEVPPVIDRAIRLRGRRMSAPALSINLKNDKSKMLACPEIIEN